EAAVLVPELAARAAARLRVVDLHAAHPALDQPPRHQALPAEDLRRLLVQAVQLPRRLGLTAESERLGSLALHAEGQLERRDAGVEGAVGLPAGAVQFVELP